MTRLKAYTVTSINGDITQSGEYIFNSDRVHSIFGEDNAVRLRYYRPQLRSMARWDEYILNETLEDVQELLGGEDDQPEYTTLTVYKDQIGFTGETFDYYVNSKDIYLAVEASSQSMVYVNTISGVKKWYCTTTVSGIIPVVTYDLVTHAYTSGADVIKIKLPSSKSVTFNWGDGESTTYTGNGSTEVNAFHEYDSSGSYNVTLSGDVDSITSIDLDDATNFSGDISGWSEFTSLEVVNAYLSNVSGDLSSWSVLSNMTAVILSSTNVSGDVGGWSTMTDATTMWIDNTSVSGDVSTWSVLTKLTWLRLNDTLVEGDVSGFSSLTLMERIDIGNTSVSGDVSTWSAMREIVTGIYLNDTSVDFDSNSSWVGGGHDLNLKNCNLTSTQVDNAIIALAGNTFGYVITLNGTNAARTSASDAALAALESDGNMVYVNE